MESETSKCRARLAPFCVGSGLDIGFGGDAIVPHAITMDMPKPYTSVGGAAQQLSGDCRNLYWFRPGFLDFIFSSHLLEDFDYMTQAKILKEWLRVLRIGGRVVLYQPDERRYREHCRTTGQPYNEAHKEPGYSLAGFKSRVIEWAALPVKVMHESPAVEIYSWEIVLEKS